MSETHDFKHFAIQQATWNALLSLVSALSLTPAQRAHAAEQFLSLHDRAVGIHLAQSGDDESLELLRVHAAAWLDFLQVDVEPGRV